MNLQRTEFINEDERKRLGPELALELENLRHRCWSDYPFSSSDYKRLQELERKLW